jgi:hypothetical protein
MWFLFYKIIIVRSAPRSPKLEPRSFKLEPHGFKSEPRGFKLEPRSFKSEPRSFKSELRGFKLEPRGFVNESRGTRLAYCTWINEMLANRNGRAVSRQGRNFFITHAWKNRNFHVRLRTYLNKYKTGDTAWGL